MRNGTGAVSAGTLLLVVAAILVVAGGVTLFTGQEDDEKGGRAEQPSAPGRPQTTAQATSGPGQPQQSRPPGPGEYTLTEQDVRVSLEIFYRECRRDGTCRAEYLVEYKLADAVPESLGTPYVLVYRVLGGKNGPVTGQIRIAPDGSRDLRVSATRPIRWVAIPQPDSKLRVELVDVTRSGDRQ